MKINVFTFTGKPMVYLACWPDRHTDDEYKVFVNEQDAKEQCKTWMAIYKHDTLIQNKQFGDWCLFITESYYAFVQKVEIIK